MLVSTASRPGATCIYCAFRSQLLHRQSHRIGRTLHLEATAARVNRPPRTGRISRRIPSKSRHVDSPLNPRFPRRVLSERPDVDAPRPLRREVRKTSRRTDEPASEYNDAKGPFVRKHFVGRPQEVKSESLPVVLGERLNALKQELKFAPLLKKLQRNRDFNYTWKSFRNTLLREVGNCSAVKKDDGVTSSVKDTYEGLREAYSLRGEKGLDDRIKYEFYGYMINSRFTASELRNQQALADLRYPTEWFPTTRSVRRSIHLHVGPTNSGKTYHALQRLEQAETGVYAGPLRLLAHEVYSRMNAKGKPCALVTGEERRAALDEEGESTMNLTSCTVEMVPLSKSMDVAVIDEIQMIGNADRGWAWTQALLGVKAKEVHLCGEERTVPLLKQICASLSEELTIHRYERLSPLEVANESLDGELSNLRKGDCVVSFSVMGIHSLRRQIERATGKRVATVYGSLPPETRAQQARLFNESNNDYDYLVASDAVGMGLNLAIKRIVFETVSKFNGHQLQRLAVADIKQIAGRAGRYRVATQEMQEMDKDASHVEVAVTAKGDIVPSSPDSSVAANDNTGYVTTLRQFDYPLVSAAMSSDPEPILTAGIYPPAVVLERFASYFPLGTPFSYIVTRLHELSQIHSRFHLCGLRDQVYIADLIEPVEGLTIADRHLICSSPVSQIDHELWKDLLPAYARCIADQAGGDIVDIAELPLEVLEAKVSPSRDYLRALERLHKGLVGYLWLSFRFAGVFGQRPLAQHVKELVEEKIERVLGSFSFSEAAAKKVAEKREQQLLRDMEAAMSAKENDGASEADNDAVPNQGNLDTARLTEEKRLRSAELLLQEQPRLTAGGERFGGEEEIAIDDEGILEEEEEELFFDTLEGDQSALLETTEGGTEEAPASTQQVTPSTKKADGNATAGYNQFGGSPPKNLKHLETNVTELERNVHSRP